MKHVRTALVCLLVPGLGAAQTVQFKMPHSGDSQISGKLTGTSNAGNVVKLVRTHADGHSDLLTAAPDASGNFTAPLPASDKLISGDKIAAAVTESDNKAARAAAAAQPALPAVTDFIVTTPPMIRFAGSLNQTRGATVKVTISSTGAWPKELLGNQTVTVVADDALQYAGGTVASGTLPAPDSLTVTLAATSPEVTVTVEDPLCEWGRVRCYAYFGTIFSQTNGDFSKTDPYLDFSVEWNWYKGKRGILTTFFDTRLTTIPAPEAPTPVAVPPVAVPPVAPSAPPPLSGAAAFASSSKSPQVMGGFYYAPWALPAWSFKDQTYSLFAAALYKGGVQGRLDGVVDSGKLAFPNQGKSVFTFNSAGVRLGFVKWHPEEGEAHDLLSYFDFTVGKYRLYDYIGPDFQGAASGPAGGASNVRHYGLRKVFEGRIKIPSVNLRVGFDANLGQGQNDLRFLVTTNGIDLFKSLLGQK